MPLISVVFADLGRLKVARTEEKPYPA